MTYKTKNVWLGSAGQNSWTRRLTNKTNGQVTVSTYGPVAKAGRAINYDHYLTRGWNTTPNWKYQRRVNGYLPTLPMWEFRSYWRQPSRPITFTQEGSTYIDYRVEDNPTVLVAYPEDVGMQSVIAKNAVMDDAKFKALAKARDLKVNLPVLFGEGRQTVRMITDTARTLGKAYRDFQRGRFFEAAKTLGITKPRGTAANHWLAYSLGWMPLVGDVKGLAELAAQQLELGGRLPRFTARASPRPVTTGQSKTIVNNFMSITETAEFKTKGETTYEGSAGLLLEIQYSTAALASQVGLGSWYDLAQFAWEVTPFSFVFDYFVDLGELLEAASSLTGLSVLTGYSSCKQTFIGSAYCSKWPLGWVVGGYLPPAPVKFQQYDRYVWTGDTPSIRMPLWDGLNGRRLTTLAALYQQLCRGDRARGMYKP
jgi:hypothetical protein